MRKVICQECRKAYDYDVDDFCPRCGAFNIPAKSQRTMIRVDGLSEANHEDSFLHDELHAEDADRKRLKLSKGTVRTQSRPRDDARPAADIRPGNSSKLNLGMPRNRASGGSRRNSGAETAGVGKMIIWIIIAIIFILNLLSR